MPPTRERGQILVLFAIIVTVLLAFAGFSVDIGRQVAERRHTQNAADAAALAACRSLIEGESDNSAASKASMVAAANLQGSPSGATATIASPATYADEDGNGSITADEMTSGIVVAGTTVRVAISSSVETLLARLVGVNSLEAGARARCDLQGGPAVPIVARRYANPPGPGGGFVDHLATAATSSSGSVDPTNPRGYGTRVPASEAQPGPTFAIYGPDSKAANDSSFRGFIALDVRNFEGVDTRVYYNGVTAGTNPNTLKDIEGEYLITGYPGPAFPPVSTPPDGTTQVAVLSGNSTSFVVGNFDDAYKVGDRLLLAVYDGTVMEIPDFSLTPPVEISLPSTTTSPVDGPTVRVSRNAQFSSTVTLSIKGDFSATTNGTPEYNIVADPPSTTPTTGTMGQPTWSTNVFLPAKNGTTVRMDDFQTLDVPAGIYTVWVEGESGNPYYQQRRVPVPVRIQTDANGDGDYNDAGDMKVTRDFSLVNSVLDGSTGSLGGPISLPIRVSTSGQAWDGGPSLETPVTLSWDTDSFTDCSLNPEPLGLASISFSATSVTPGNGQGTLSTLSINTTGLSQGCYMFTVRAHGTNGDGQPVTHLQRVRFTVATTTSSGQYVDIIGFAVFQVDTISSNSITGHAVSGISADPGDQNLRRAQRARLVPWS
ncbi:MAG TPA: pilus assembly protein TadG-related protein [Candidatus Limnocylindria bacterium]|nr:pilus assembly protein TadG-related protein [Candidatus Limnocylindria bacterium]